MPVLTVMVAAVVLLFVGCPDGTGGGSTSSYIGSWEHIDGSFRELFIFTSNTWELQSQELISSNWVISWKAKGTMSASANTLTITITGVSTPYYGYPNWYDSSYWDYYDPNFNYYLYYIYYYWWYYVGGYQAATIGVPYSLTTDGNSLVITVPDGYGGTMDYTFTRV